MKTSIFFLLLLGAAVPLSAQNAPMSDQFTFLRIRYNMGDLGLGFHMRYGTINSWQVDYPTAEEHFMDALSRGTSLPIADRAVSLTLTDRTIYDYSFAYIVEVGYLELRPEEAEALREWLLRGGFLLIDDFHGPFEWRHFSAQIKKVFPDREVRKIDPSHPIFHCFYEFDSYPAVPGLGSILRGTTYEKGGRVPECRGIFDDEGRLMVLINHNVDLGDSWEHASDFRYPREYSILGYKLGINYIVYALTH